MSDIVADSESGTGAEPTPVGERVTFALRQALLMGVALLLAGRVADGLRPPEALDRGIVDTPFLWAILVWIVVLLVNAVAFERSHMRALERTPLFAGLAVGGLVLIVGLATFDGGTAGRRFAYLVANSVGAVLFWWAMFSLVYLAVRRLDPVDDKQPLTGETQTEAVSP